MIAGSFLLNFELRNCIYSHIVIESEAKQSMITRAKLLDCRAGIPARKDGKRGFRNSKRIIIFLAAEFF